MASKSKNFNQTEGQFPTLELVRTSRLVRFIGRLTLIATILMICAMVFAPWQQTARCTGRVVALDPQERVQEVVAGIEGVVAFVKPGLREGSYVEAGEIVMRLEPLARDGVNQIQQQITFARLELASADSKLLQAIDAVTFQERNNSSTLKQLNNELLAAKQKLQQLATEVEVLEEERIDVANQLRIAEKTRGALTPEEEFVSKRQKLKQVEGKIQKAEQAQAEAQSKIDAKVDEIGAKEQKLEVELTEKRQKQYEAEQSVQKIKKNILDLEQKSDKQDRLVVTATKSGFIQQWYGLVGSDTVKKGQPLFTLVPDATELAVEMKINGNDLPLVHEGDHVRLQFEGWPAVQFVGWPSVAVGTFGGKVNRVFPTDDSKGTFTIIVTEENKYDTENAWPDDRYLRQGIRANGWVLLKQVPLGWEIWRQLNGFPPVVSDKNPGKVQKDAKESKVKVPKA